MGSPFTQERKHTLGEVDFLVAPTGSKLGPESSALACALSSSPWGWRRLAVDEIEGKPSAFLESETYHRPMEKSERWGKGGIRDRIPSNITSDHQKGGDGFFLTEAVYIRTSLYQQNQC